MSYSDISCVKAFSTVSYLTTIVDPTLINYSCILLKYKVMNSILASLGSVSWLRTNLSNIKKGITGIY